MQWRAFQAEKATLAESQGYESEWHVRGMATACVPVHRELERTHHRTEGHRGALRADWERQEATRQRNLDFGLWAVGIADGL